MSSSPDGLDAYPLGSVEAALDAIISISLRCHQCDDLEALLAYSVTALRELVGSDRSLIYQFLPQDEGLIVAESMGAGWPSVIPQLQADAGLHQQWTACYRRGGERPAESPSSNIDPSDGSPSPPQWWVPLQIQAHWVIPILTPAPRPLDPARSTPALPLSETAVWGVFILHQCGAAQTWSALHRHVLPQLVTHLGLAISQRLQQAAAQQLVATIADLQETTVALQRREVQHQLAVDLSKTGCWEFDVTTGKAQWNDNQFRLMGLAPLASLSHYQTWRDRIHPDDLAQTEATFQQAIATQTELEVEYRILYPDGTVRWMWNRGRGIENETGAIERMVGVMLDITDRKEMEAVLRLREQEFRTLAENSPDCIWRCDRQCRILYVNPIFTILIGISTPELIGQTIAALGLPAALVERWQAAITQAWQTAQEQALEYELDLPWGACIFYARIVPETGLNGDIISVLWVARDVTNLKRAQQVLMHQADREHSLRLMTQHMRETLDLAEILATAVTEVQRLLHADRALIFQLCPDRSGVVIQEAVRPEFPATLATRWSAACFPPACYAAYHQGQVRILSHIRLDDWGHCLGEFRLRTAVRSMIVAPITHSQEDGSSNVWGLLIVHACTEQRLWQPDEAEILRQVTDQLAIAIQQSELHHQVQQWAATLEQQVQERTVEIQQALELEETLRRITDKLRDSLDEEQILETVVQELGLGLKLECCDTGIYNADRTTSTITHEFTQSLVSVQGTTFAIATATHADLYPALFQGEVVQFCHRVPCALRGNPGDLAVLACPIMDDQRVLGDIWLYKPGYFTPAEVRLGQQVANQCAIALRQSRLYQAAQTQVRELERLHHLKDDFLSTVSHELRTPMANIKMAMQMLAISLASTPVLTDKASATSRYFQILETECDREIQLINDLLDLTHLEAQTEPLQLIEADLRYLLPHIAEPFTTRTQQQEQQLLIDIPEILPKIYTDLSYLERCVTELLNNACKYTPRGETIRLAVEILPTTLAIAISNSGVEIAPAERDRIFDKFYRIPHHDPWKYGGTGLGLALVKRLVECLDGTITVHSSPAGITTFTIQLPLAGLA